MFSSIYPSPLTAQRKSIYTVIDSEPISSLLTLSEWEELERIIEAVASLPNLEADLLISDSETENEDDSSTWMDERSASQASTVDLTLVDNITLDELYGNLDSLPELTRDPMEQVYWGNTIKISRYIQDLQQPGGAKDGRILTPFCEEIQPLRADSPLDVVVEILQCIIKILCIVVFASLCFLYFK
jgi:hypothetical protein